MKRNLKMMDVEMLTVGRTYQRFVESSRCREIKNSIKKDGFWDHSIVVVNTKNEIVDGQHRWLAAKELGIKKLMVSIVEFENKEKEAEFFWTINNYKSTHLKPKDYWFARYQSSCVIANTLYALNEQPDSLINNSIALKGHDTNTKLAIPASLFLISYCARNKMENWSRERNDDFIKSITNIGIKEIIRKSNEIMSFIYDSFGRISHANQNPYTYGNFRAILSFHKIIGNSELGITKDAIKKMHAFIFTSDFDRVHHSMKVQSLVNWYNSGKSQKNKIKYEA